MFWCTWGVIGAIKYFVLISAGVVSAGEDGVETIGSFSRASGTGLMINLRPVEWTTCVVALGASGIKKTEKHKHHICEYLHAYCNTCNLCSTLHLKVLSVIGV